MTSILPKIDPEYINASDVELLVKAKDFLYAKGEIAQPHKETYICYAIQKAAGIEGPFSLFKLVELERWKGTHELASVIRLTIMIQMALATHEGDCSTTPEDTKKGSYVSKSYGGSVAEYAQLEAWDTSLRIHRHAWLDYMIATCKAHFNQ